MSFQEINKVVLSNDVVKALKVDQPCTFLTTLSKEDRNTSRVHALIIYLTPIAKVCIKPAVKIMVHLSIVNRIIVKAVVVKIKVDPKGKDPLHSSFLMPLVVDQDES